MYKIPPLSCTKMVKLLGRLGYVGARQSEVIFLCRKPECDVKGDYVRISKNELVSLGGVFSELYHDAVVRRDQIYKHTLL